MGCCIDGLVQYSAAFQSASQSGGGLYYIHGGVNSDCVHSGALLCTPPPFSSSFSSSSPVSPLSLSRQLEKARTCGRVQEVFCARETNFTDPARLNCSICADDPNRSLGGAYNYLQAKGKQPVEPLS